MISRGVIARVDDTTPTQTIQVELRYDELADSVELLQPFGLSFNPETGSEVLVLAAGASQEQLVALNATSRQSRPTGVSTGQGGLYDPDGWKIFLSNDGLVHIGAQEGSQSVQRGEETIDAIKAFADAVGEAIGQITGQVTTTTAVASVQQAATELKTQLDSALSEKVKVE
jgi:phage baseplate assembly protein V